MEASEGASNDAVVASLGRLVGGHVRLGSIESDSPHQKRKMSWRGTAQQKLRLSAADLVFVTRTFVTRYACNISQWQGFVFEFYLRSSPS